MTFAFIFDSVCGTEWLVLLGVILIVVGPKNLPSAMRKFGQITAQLRRAADEFKRQIMAMDEEVRRTVDDAVKTDYVETPKDGETADDPSKVPDDASGDDGVDRAETENDYYGGEYDENSPYPGHEYYDETTYQNDDDGTTGDASANPQPDTAAAPEVEKPKVDPYEVKITVSTTADKKKGKGAQA